jgi:hypothetical protein
MATPPFSAKLPFRQSAQYQLHLLNKITISRLHYRLSHILGQPTSSFSARLPLQQAATTTAQIKKKPLTQALAIPLINSLQKSQMPLVKDQAAAKKPLRQPFFKPAGFHDNHDGHFFQPAGFHDNHDGHFFQPAGFHDDHDGHFFKPASFHDDHDGHFSNQQAFMMTMTVTFSNQGAFMNTLTFL